MKLFNIKAICFTGLFLGLAQTSAMAFKTNFSGSNDTVEKVLLLDIDVSGSVTGGNIINGSQRGYFKSNNNDPNEYELIMEGYAAAFENPDIQNGIINVGSGNGIVVGVQFWATYQKMLTDPSGNKWFLLEDTTDINEFATLLRNADRPFNNSPDNIGGGTNLAGALDRSQAEINALLTGSGTFTDRSATDIKTVSATQGIIENVLIETIVDVSSDGYSDRATFYNSNGSCNDDGGGLSNNDPDTTTRYKTGLNSYVNCQTALVNAINSLVDNGPANRINALPILGETSRYLDILDVYYESGLTVNSGTIGPVIAQDSGAAADAFVIEAQNFSSFSTAIEDKLLAEITATAVPFEFSPGLGLIVGGSIFGFLKLRKK